MSSAVKGKEDLYYTRWFVQMERATVSTWLRWQKGSATRTTSGWHIAHKNDLKTLATCSCKSRLGLQSWKMRMNNYSRGKLKTWLHTGMVGLHEPHISRGHTQKGTQPAGMFIYEERIHAFMQRGSRSCCITNLGGRQYIWCMSLWRGQVVISETSCQH